MKIDDTEYKVKSEIKCESKCEVKMDIKHEMEICKPGTSSSYENNYHREQFDKNITIKHHKSNNNVSER